MPDAEPEVVVAPGGDERRGAGHERHQIEPEHVAVEARVPPRPPRFRLLVEDEKVLLSDAHRRHRALAAVWL